MSDQAAAYALDKLASTGDVAAAEKLARLLLNDPAIGERWDPCDIPPAISNAVRDMTETGTSADSALDGLRETLRNEPGTVLIAVFATATASERQTYGRLELGPAAEILDSDLTDPPLGWTTLPRANQLAVRIDDPAPGARGRRSAFQWLRSGIGALYLAARAAGAADSRIGPVPTDEISPSLFIGNGTALACLVPAMRLPGAAHFDVDAVLGHGEAREMMGDCLASAPSDLVAQRLRDAAPWVQLGFDALAYPDAVLALGIALECLLGSESKEDPVTKVVSTRAGFLLRRGRSRADRVLTAGESRDKTRRLYEARSKVAHGRYTVGKAPEQEERETRREFEELVYEVASAFRSTGRSLSWKSAEDLRAWQEELELA